MKRTTLVAAMTVLALVRTAQADFLETFNSGFANGGLIPDGNLTGWSDTRTVAEVGNVTGISVGLHLTSGWNGDLYAYLTHSDGFAVLLNRVGRGTDHDGTSTGYGTAGMDVTLTTLGSDIHWVPNPGTGTFAADGRDISPLSAVGDFNADGTAFLSSFIDKPSNGAWTLFIADVSGGDQSTLADWTLNLQIAAVPEPASLIEGSVAVLFLGGIVWLYRRKAAKQQPQVS